MWGKGSKRRLLALAAGMTLLAGLALMPSPVAAEQDMPYMRGGVPQPLPPEDLVTYYNPFLRDDEMAALQQALAGDCRALLRRFGPGPDRSGVMEAFRIELLDRGLCVAFDPVEAARRFEARMSRLDAPTARVIVAWKYHYGHGVPRDPERARDLFVEHVTDLYLWMDLSGLGAFRYSTKDTLTERVLSQLEGRPAPREFLDGLAWTERQSGTDAGAVELGRTLIWGGDLAYVDGGPLPRLPVAGLAILRNVRDAEAQFLVGKAGMEGLWHDGTSDWPFYVEQAAYCRHVEAATLLATLLHSGRHPDIPRNLDEAEMWRRLAITFGAKEEDLFEPTFLHRMFGLEHFETAWTERILSGSMCHHD